MNEQKQLTIYSHIYCSAAIYIFFYTSIQKMHNTSIQKREEALHVIPSFLYNISGRGLLKCAVDKPTT